MSGRMQGSALEIPPQNAQRAAQLAAVNDRLRKVSPRLPLDGVEHVIYGGRQEGKTYLATRWLNETPAGTRRILVTYDRNLARSITAQVSKGVDAHAISFRTLLEAGADPGTEYGFDETLAILGDLFKLHESPRLVTVMTAAAWQGTPDESDADGFTSITRDGLEAFTALGDEPMLRYFTHDHLPEGPLKETSRLFSIVARQLVKDLPRSPERTIALRKLLESKDAAVRAALDVPQA